MGSLDDYEGRSEEWAVNELIDRLTFPGYWPPGLPDQVLRWFKAGKYDPRTMPKLRLAENPDGNISLLGWGEATEDTPNFIQAVRGFGLTGRETQVTRAWPNVVWCPRCWEDAYVPYDAEDREAGYAEGFHPPALSRTSREENDAKIYVCSACGQDEAMQDFSGLGATSPTEWPIGRKGFGWGGPVFPGELVQGEEE